MVVLRNSSGQLGNKLLFSSHILAYCLSNKETFIDLILSSDAKYFSILNGIKNKAFLIESKAFRFLINIILLVINKLMWSIFKVQLVDKHKIGWIHTETKSINRISRALVLEGEGFRSSGDIKIHTDTIKSIFTPKNKFLKQIKTEAIKYRGEGYTLVGIHLRRGDYKDWMDGKYYFNDSVYKAVIQQVENLKIAKNIRYILFSNEPIQTENFQEKNIFVSTNTMIVDMYLLAECDYIIGPPSTFSGWASFYGSVPLYTLESDVFKITKEQFNVFQL
ncbi:hypothetical protein GVN20_26540 [Runella sp. CRIBMP]|uniref:alpha-1,2-fucosyltransferase n=1 Tax=Runella sp. CRIBMP TaxID=2683261 RepID=UPI001412651B|nr:alpha-1,2-fucosyltransferase [Runella sp. CRIBMP]NBB22943.1 hypothetical protein [Runella sp. CRIBMP]